jgi:hypothetical protein
MARAFAPTLRPPWIVAACAFTGAAAAWVASSSAPLVLRWIGLIQPEGWGMRLVYCAWLATTHGVAALLHQRREGRETPLCLWTFAGGTIVPGFFLWLLVCVVTGGAVLGRPSSVGLEATMLGLVPSVLALPVVAAIAAAETRPTPGRALAVLAGGLLVPWCLGEDRIFAIALAAALTLSAIALALADVAARNVGVRVRCVRAGGESYRDPGRILLQVTEIGSTAERARSGFAVAVAFIVVLGALQIAVLANATPP